jgi:hypothetical protein
VIGGAVGFALFAIGLISVGWWGHRSSGRLSVRPGLDESLVARRRAVARRGAYTCYAAAALFLVVAGLLLFSRGLECPRIPGQCTAECALAHQCAEAHGPTPSREQSK